MHLPDPDRSPRIPSELVAEEADYADVVEQFLAGLPNRVAQLEAALDTADMDRFRRAVHQLKGSAGGHGYPGLSDLARKVEQQAAAGELDACVRGLDEIKSLLSCLVVSL